MQSSYPRKPSKKPYPQPLARQPSALTVDNATHVPKKIQQETPSPTAGKATVVPTVGKATLIPSIWQGNPHTQETHARKLIHNLWQDNPRPHQLARQPSYPRKPSKKPSKKTQQETPSTIAGKATLAPKKTHPQPLARQPSAPTAAKATPPLRPQLC